MLKLAVLASGRGSNLGAILRAIDAGRCAAEVALVASDRPGAPALALAAERGIRTAVVSLAAHPDRAAWDAALASRVAESDPTLVVLAGFMRLVGPSFLARFPRRIINVHPALLPLFPGVDGPGDAIRANVRVSGCTVHVVDAGVDTGPILAQTALRVLPQDDADSLHARIQRAEHLLLPRVIHAIARGTITLEPEIRIHETRDDGEQLVSPMLADDSS